MASHDVPELLWRQVRAECRTIANYVVGAKNPSGDRRVRVEPATTSMIMVVPLGGGVSVASAGGTLHLRECFVCPPRAHHLVVEQRGCGWTIEVGLSHDAARNLWDLRLGDLDRPVYTFEELAPGRAEALHQRLGSAPDWSAAFAAVEASLVPKRRSVSAAKLDRAWRLLGSQEGRSVAEVAARVGWSRRTLSTRFRERYGISPKMVARISRFERARRMLLTGGRLAPVAFRCGYFDQAHMHRDFREFDGRTPASVVRDATPLEAAWAEQVTAR